MKLDKINVITLQRISTTKNSLGNPVLTSFTNVKDYLASWETKYGKTFYAAEALHEEVTGRFTIWFDYNCQPVEQEYILYNGSRFLILAINDIGGLHREIEIYVKRAAV